LIRRSGAIRKKKPSQLSVKLKDDPNAPRLSYMWFAGGLGATAAHDLAICGIALANARQGIFATRPMTRFFV
jgi:hypothetical protein